MDSFRFKFIEFFEKKQKLFFFSVGFESENFRVQVTNREATCLKKMVVIRRLK